MTEILKPLENSAAFDIEEMQLKELFIKVFTELYGKKVTDIYNYGTPTYGSPLVLERFIKQIGLVLLRRPDTSHLIMRILYENWTALPSKRGLAFLEFTLEMLWTNKWKIHRLWHSRMLANYYPNLVTVTEQPGSFLTSRIYVLMQTTIDQQELELLSPALSRLVPANIVPEFGIGVEVENMAMGVASAMHGIQIGYFVPEDW